MMMLMLMTTILIIRFMFTLWQQLTCKAELVSAAHFVGGGLVRPAAGRHLGQYQLLGSIFPSQIEVPEAAQHNGCGFTTRWTHHTLHKMAYVQHMFSTRMYSLHTYVGLAVCLASWCSARYFSAGT
jgi:hypothetical protein